MFKIHSLKASLLILCSILVSACGGGSSSSGSGSDTRLPFRDAVPTTTGIPGPEIPATRQGTEFIAEQCIQLDFTVIVVFNICDQRVITRDFFPLGVFEPRIYPILPMTGIRFLEDSTRSLPSRVPACFAPYVPAGEPNIDEYSCLLP